MPTRYYVYASDAKIDMIAGQLSPALRQQIAKELKIDVKLLSLTLKDNPTEENRYRMLDLAERTLLEEGKVGALDSDKKWFRGTLPLHWGRYRHHEKGADYDPLFPMVFFAGQTANVDLGLGGSMKHLIGEEVSMSEEALKAQKLPLFTSFSDGFSILSTVREAALDKANPSSSPIGAAAVASSVRQIVGSTKALGLPPPEMEFLALRLLDEHRANKRVILGTPLYVARA